MEHEHKSDADGAMKSKANIALINFPILAFMYVHLARREERDARAEFGEAYARYEAVTPAFIPGFAVKVHA